MIDGSHNVVSDNVFDRDYVVIFIMEVVMVAKFWGRHYASGNGEVIIDSSPILLLLFL